MRGAFVNDGPAVDGAVSMIHGLTAMRSAFMHGRAVVNRTALVYGRAVMN